MGTDIRPRVSKKNKYWIERQRYYELKHFCMQYKTWVKQLDAYDSMVRSDPDSVLLKKNGEYSDPVPDCVAKRELYLLKKEMIDLTAEATDEDLGEYILYGVTLGISYDIVKQKFDVPCSKDKYYELYRRFFWLLNTMRDAVDLYGFEKVIRQN